MAKKKDRNGGTPAIDVLTADGAPFTVHAYDHDPRVASYGEEAAAALGIAVEQVFKTLLADVDGTLVVAVVPVSGQLDLKALARAVGGRRATMADPKAAERATGYVVGGISPLGQKRRHTTVVDASALTHPRINVSAGRRGLEIELSPADLIRLTDAVSAPVGRP